jgi:hypothetical protein
VAELHPGKLALAEAEPEEEQERYAVALSWLGGEQLPHVALGEGPAGDITLPRSEDW